MLYNVELMHLYFYLSQHNLEQAQDLSKRNTFGKM